MTDNVELFPEPTVADHNYADKYPYDYVKWDGHIYIYYDRETMVPKSWVPDACTSWAGQKRVAWAVRREASAGKLDNEIKKAVEADYRAFNKEHLRSRAYETTLKNALKKSLVYERRGWNSWPDDVLEVEGRPDLVAIKFDPTPKKGPKPK